MTMVKFKWEKDFKEAEFAEIPQVWEQRTLKDVIASTLKGRPAIKKYLAKGNHPYLSVKYLRGEEEPSEFFSEEAGEVISTKDIIVLWDGANAGEIFRGKKGILSSTMVKLIFKEDEVSDYLYMLLKCREEDLKEAKSGSDDRHVDKDYFNRISIPYPQPKEQSRIASILSWFDDLIENKKRQNEILEQSAEALFKSWFIDFEPFKKEKFENSELGEIPKGWEVKPISEIADVGNGVSYNGQEKFIERTKGGYIFVTLNNAIEGGGFKPEYAWIKSDRIKEKHFVEEGDLIIPNTEQTKDERLLGSPGLVFFPPDYNEKKGVYSHHITKISPSDKRYITYLYLFLKFTREDSSSFHTGTGVLGLDIKNFRVNKMIICPPEPILEKFHSLTEPLFKKIIRNQKQIMTLKKVKDTLLPLLVFGRLRVEEI